MHHSVVYNGIILHLYYCINHIWIIKTSLVDCKFCSVGCHADIEFAKVACKPMVNPTHKTHDPSCLSVACSMDESQIWQFIIEPCPEWLIFLFDLYTLKSLMSVVCLYSFLFDA